MPVVKIPTIQTLKSRNRICAGILQVYAEERRYLELLAAIGEISQQELIHALADLNFDTEQIKAQQESNRIIYRTSSAA